MVQCTCVAPAQRATSASLMSASTSSGKPSSASSARVSLSPEVSAGSQSMGYLEKNTYPQAISASVTAMSVMVSARLDTLPGVAFMT